MRKLASIQRIWKIEPIEGADRIELAHVLGWQCVVNKGQFQEMDQGVYFEVDSFLPLESEFEFLRPTEPVYCELISAALSMKVVSNKYLLKNE